MDNKYKFFAIMVAIIESGMVVDHLPMENSWIIKCVFDRGAQVYAILACTNYCVLPLIQRGCEIPSEKYGTFCK